MDFSKLRYVGEYSLVLRCGNDAEGNVASMKFSWNREALDRFYRSYIILQAFRYVSCLL